MGSIQSSEEFWGRYRRERSQQGLWGRLLGRRGGRDYYLAATVNL